MISLSSPLRPRSGRLAGAGVDRAGVAQHGHAGRERDVGRIGAVAGAAGDQDVAQGRARGRDLGRQARVLGIHDERGEIHAGEQVREFRARVAVVDVHRDRAGHHAAEQRLDVGHGVRQVEPDGLVRPDARGGEMLGDLLAAGGQLPVGQPPAIAGQGAAVGDRVGDRCAQIGQVKIHAAAPSRSPGRAARQAAGQPAQVGDHLVFRPVGHAEQRLGDAEFAPAGEHGRVGPTGQRGDFRRARPARVLPGAVQPADLRPRCRSRRAWSASRRPIWRSRQRSARCRPRRAGSACAAADTASATPRIRRTGRSPRRNWPPPATRAPAWPRDTRAAPCAAGRPARRDRSARRCSSRTRPRASTRPPDRWSSEAMVLASVMGSCSAGSATAVPSLITEVTAAAMLSDTHGSSVRR